MVYKCEWLFIVIIETTLHAPSLLDLSSLCDCIAFTYSLNAHRQASLDYVREALKPVTFFGPHPFCRVLSSS